MSVASFHLIRYPRSYRGAAASRMYYDRAPLRSTPGLRFWRLLGTARGQSMNPSADLDRWAMVAVWDDESALGDFLDSSQIAARWDREAIEACTIRLDHSGGRGSWGGRYPFPEAGEAPASDAPVAVLTRASIRPTRLLRFYRAVPPVDLLLTRQSGLLRSIGMGEWPLARQATFSIWRNRDAVTRFAYRSVAHADVVVRTRDEGWYGEEMFSRFAVLGVSGTWDGSSPMSTLTR